MKRKTDAPGAPPQPKRVKLSTADMPSGTSAPNPASASAATPTTAAAAPPQKARRIKLTPARPFPTAPRSQSATGPRSAYKEGKNLICVTRKTPLGAYMRRCKDVLLKDGYTSLTLSAMGAAIPHLLKLAAALPPILPYGDKDLRIEYTTGTVQVQDEIRPDDEDEDISYETRAKSQLRVVFTVGGHKLKEPTRPQAQGEEHEPMETI
ncbi:hypothetical protein CYLTODRAFT_426858 [Cylindrobasidium torrendii FP15055 ss-10]|uniref:Uncharacterized protein n=1 Tax=Cylindrobasidium torrendii FP15055 ss-10 TaxID=1314674 RepID=A0A0D7AXC0_9AGAR|nr:hypothetical protein CYLTODRAFT_426858 [Cylindrobasidium torrendii FP15055 ss-10]